MHSARVVGTPSACSASDARNSRIDERSTARPSPMREYGVSQMPVVKHEPPVVLAEVVGSVTERELMDTVFADSAVLDHSVSDVMGAPLPTIGAGEQVHTAVTRLERAPALLVHGAPGPISSVDRQLCRDLGRHLASSAGGDLAGEHRHHAAGPDEPFRLRPASLTAPVTGGSSNRAASPRSLRTAISNRG